MNSEEKDVKTKTKKTPAVSKNKKTTKSSDKNNTKKNSKSSNTSKAKTNSKSTRKPVKKTNSKTVNKTRAKASNKTTVKKVVKKSNIKEENTVKKIETDNKKKQTIKMVDLRLIIPVVLSVVFLIILVVSATYAYFAVNSTNNFNTTNLDVSVGDIGSVAINSDNAKLTLDLTLTQMLQLGEDVPYYASKTGTTTTDTFEEMGNISVAGAGIFDCAYTLEIKPSAKSDETNMFNKFQNMAGKSEGQIVLTINTQDGSEVYDFYDSNLFANGSIIYNGEANGVKEGSPESIKAQLKLVNKTGVVQDDLKGTDITLSLSVNTFECEIVG